MLSELTNVINYAVGCRGGFSGVSRVSRNPFWCGLNSRLTEKRYSVAIQLAIIL